MKRTFGLLFLISLLLLLAFLHIKEVYLVAVSFHIALFSFSMFFVCGKDLDETIKKIGIFRSPLRDTIYGFLGFLALVAISLVLNVLFYYAGVGDYHNVVETVEGFPPYLIMFMIFFAPISEELFFRRLLTEKFGILISAVVFSISHFAYGSVIEIVGAFFMGIALGWLYKFSNSVIPVIISHLLFNLTSVIVMKMLFGI